MSRVLVCGGRDFADRDFLFSILDELAPTTIIQGGARGADSLAANWAVRRNANVEEYPADWKKYPKAAGPIRNQLMLEKSKPDLVVAFTGGDGTADMVRRAIKAGVPVIDWRKKVSGYQSDG